MVRVPERPTLISYHLSDVSAGIKAKIQFLETAHIPNCSEFYSKDFCLEMHTTCFLACLCKVNREATMEGRRLSRVLDVGPQDSFRCVSRRLTSHVALQNKPVEPEAEAAEANTGK
jgi:hypothetical protein